MISNKEFKKAQKDIEEEIYELAEKQGLSNEDIAPITDGVCSIEGYLNSYPKTMWVLKEPVDEIIGDSPAGGGWSIPRHCFGDKEKRKRNMAVPTWRRMAYTMFGYLNGLKSQDLAIISEKQEMAASLENIAYINVSKMPGFSQSDPTKLKKCYNKWKSVLDRQVEIYDPDVIIFGNTFQFFKEDFLRKGLDEIGMIGGFNCFRSKKCILIAAYHPGCKISTATYVDGLIEILNYFFPLKNSY